jgi:hypothetical protein
LTAVSPLWTPLTRRAESCEPEAADGAHLTTGASYSSSSKYGHLNRTGLRKSISTVPQKRSAAVTVIWEPDAMTSTNTSRLPSPNQELVAIARHVWHSEPFLVVTLGALLLLGAVLDGLSRRRRWR